MSRTIRKVSSADYYHIIFRGAGKQIIFEDDKDRLLFLRLLDKYLEELDGEVLAWTLMSDHVHLVLHMSLELVARLMQKLGATYFANFNKKTERTGPVTQGRFHSEPINDDGYLMVCVRYVHQNIEKANVCRMEAYEWSSYREYAGLGPGVSPLRTETDFVLAVFGGLEGFLLFHETRDYAVPCIDVGKTRKTMTDDEALIFAKSLLGEETLYHLKELEKPIRDENLRKLKRSVISIRQIGRLTGLGTSIIARA